MSFLKDTKMMGKVRNQLFLNKYIILSSQREIIFTDIVQMVELLFAEKSKEQMLFDRLF
jgi:hypothetical protein